MENYQADRKKQVLYVLITTIIAVLLVGNFIYSIISNMNKYAGDNSIGVRTLNGTYNIVLNSSKHEVGMNVFMIVITLAVYAFFLNNILVEHRKLDIDDDYIVLYPSFDKIMISWKSIHAIHVGYMHDQGSRFSFYRMKILYTLDGEKLQSNSIPVLKFINYEALLASVKSKCDALKIDYFKV